MSDLINKYIEEHDKFFEALIKYYPAHENVLERPSIERVKNLRKIYKEMRLALKSMEQLSQQMLKERKAELRLKYITPKENNNE